MGTTLHTLAPNPGATRKRKRVGRGPGSGRGKTSTRGQKGQKARSGHHGARVGFEGGQMPMQRRLPKRGFTNPFRVEAFPVNLRSLEDRFEAGVVDIDMLRASGLVPKKANVIKILGSGDLTKAFQIQAHRFSQSAIDKINAAGGSVEIVGKPAKAAAPEAAPTAPAEE
jgi:large subunit ribosomal protein L15